MPETVEKPKNVDYMPVLYTAEMVLLPFENQSLKIRTAAHRQIVKDTAHDGTKFFGVSFLDKNAGAADKPEIGSIGCVAELKRIRLSSGGGKIADVRGVVRYRIEGYRDDTDDLPYPVASVAFVEDEPEDEEEVRELSLETERIIRRVIAKGGKGGAEQGEAPIFQSKPVIVSFLLADLFNLDNASRQAFLDFRLTSERLKACRERLLAIEDGTDAMITRQQFLQPFYSAKHK